MVRVDRQDRGPVLAAPSEAPAIRQLDAALEQTERNGAELIGPDGERLVLPASVHRLLHRLVHELARGHAVTVVPVHAELTTQQAADLLNVSRPFLVKLLESGEIPFHRTGAHRRIGLSDLLTYREERSRARLAALAEMAREAQEMGLYE